MSHDQKNDRKPITSHDLFILALTSSSLILLMIPLFFDLNRDTLILMMFMDTIICVFLLIDFIRMLIRAHYRLAYLKWGWIDFVGSLPMLPFVRWLLIVRLVRIARLLRHIHSRQMLQRLNHERAEGAMLVALFLAIMMLGISSILILSVEHDHPDATIHTTADALWWAFVTVTTVGYGDTYPVTNAGRLIAVLLMSTGVGLFSVLTSYLATIFSTPRTLDHEIDIAKIRTELAALRTILHEQHQALAALHRTRDEEPPKHDRSE